MQILTPRARLARLIATVAGAGLLLAGTAWGSDDAFPFGPFSMFADFAPPDADAPDTRVLGIDVTGAEVNLDERSTGIRRAEIEGHEQVFREHPSLLANVAAAYAGRNPAAPRLRLVRLVIRWHDIEDSRPRGTYHDEVVAQWSAG